MKRYRYDYDAHLRRLPPPPGFGAVGPYGVDPMFYGWETWGDNWFWPPHPLARSRTHPDRAPIDPRDSSTFGRSGDREVRRWAARYAYDMEIAIPPRYPRRGYDESPPPRRGWSGRPR